MGDGRGHWEGDSLVVETRNFRISYRGSNPAKTRVIERFTPVDSQTVEWRVTIDDPSTWTRPWTFAVPLTKDPTQPPYEYALAAKSSTSIPSLYTSASSLVLHGERDVFTSHL
jgi:hypothetical protein